MAQTTQTARYNAYSTAATGGSLPASLIVEPDFPFIKYMRRYDTPMLDMFNDKNGGPKTVSMQEGWEYGESDLIPRTSAFAEDLDTTETGVTVTSGHGVRFQVWDLIRNDATGEIMLVLEVNTTSDILTVTRGWGSTSGTADVSNTDAISILGPAIPENADYELSASQRGETFVQYAQIMEFTWQMSHRAEITPTREAPGNQFKYELEKKIKEAAERFDNLLLSGVKNQGDGTDTNPSSFGGIREWTSTYVTDMGSNTVPIELNDLLTQAQTVYLDVGMKEMGKSIMAGPLFKRILNSWYQASRRTTNTDAKINTVWNSIETDFGTFTWVPNHKCDSDEMFVLNPSDWSLHYYGTDGKWHSGAYAEQGWYKVGFYRADVGPIFQGERRRFRIHDFSTTAADYPLLDIAA